MSTLNFDNRFVAQLPGDPDTAVRPRQVHGAAWSKVAPTPVSSPRLLAATPELAAAIGFDRSDMDGTDFAEEFAEVFAGNRLLAGMQTYAACYGGHQFGHWAGQLGDGRAIGLGEVIGRDGARYELQLKGSGPTPYSRHADGRAVLRSSLREFLCSEAMLHLGIPTTRALSLVSTGERVVRDMFYDGNPQAEPGAIVCRVAPSFIRFGTFELPAARGDHALLQQLVDFTIERDFPHIQGSPEQQRGEWFVEVCERTATLMAHWMRVGFVHGVMNTDNLSILGLTIDYGPYGWIDAFDPNWTPNTTDAQGRRYAYGRQPEIAHWNLARLAEALAPLFPDPAALHAGLKRYAECFSREHAAMTAAKLGLDNWSDSDFDLARDLYALMEAAEIDMTICFRALALMDPDAPSLLALEAAFYDPARAAAHASELTAWLQRYGARLREDAQPAPRRRALMDAVNPVYLPRNYLAQQAIDAATAGELGPLHELQQVLRDPYREQAGMQRYAARRPEWARQRAGCSMLSCSS